MPRQPWLDAPGTLHHVIGRGIEGSKVFRNRGDREDFLDRLAKLSEAKAFSVYAWALMGSHFHLLVRSGNQSLSESLRRLLTGYVVNFNRRHKRSGHLFQNRYKSILCEEDPYLLELSRYIHLNPLRARMVKNLERLKVYPWTGHSAIAGKQKRDWPPLTSGPPISTGIGWQRERVRQSTCFQPSLMSPTRSSVSWEEVSSASFSRIWPTPNTTRQAGFQATRC
ncbi:MAG: hypothetical protein FJ117_02205 [Deltaproteobacteria bacterium]|nr:hypothetical protein [Deltaproteobacteria bacterium]